MSKKRIMTENSEESMKREERLDKLERQFIESLIKLRKDRRLTQQTMADDAGVIRETIARIENSITSPQVNTLLKIIEPLGYTIKLAKIDSKKLEQINKKA